MSNRVSKIQELLEKALAPTHITIHDDSQSHAGHAGASAGGGHFYATIIASVFEGQTLVKRHQMVYEALGELMTSDIHALSIKAFTPIEFERLQQQE
jgi:BolA protein